MKIRAGFVSNSSSSSFLVAIKGDVKELDKKLLMKKFKIDPSSPLAEINNEIVECIVNKCQKIDRSYLINEGFSEEDLEDDNRAQLMSDGFSVFEGFMSDESYDNNVETLLCNYFIKYKDDNVIIEGGGGY